MTHICIGQLTTIGSDNDLSPWLHQAIILANAGIIWTLRNKIQLHFANCVLPFDKSLILGCLWPLVFVFYNPSPPRMFLSLDLLWEYRIQHGANGPLYVTSSYSIWIFCRGVSGFATDCPCGVWCRGLTTCLLHVGPSFGNQMLNNSWAVGFDIMDNISYFFCVLTYAIIYVLIHQIIFWFYLLKYSLFFQVLLH